VTAVISLECTPEVVCERIGQNAGGDRAGRSDDDLPAIAEAAAFQERTLRCWSTTAIAAPRSAESLVSVHTTPAAIRQHLQIAAPARH